MIDATEASTAAARADQLRFIFDNRHALPCATQFRKLKLGDWEVFCDVLNQRLVARGCRRRTLRTFGRYFREGQPAPPEVWDAVRDIYPWLVPDPSAVSDDFMRRHVEEWPSLVRAFESIRRERPRLVQLARRYYASTEKPVDFLDDDFPLLRLKSWDLPVPIDLSSGGVQWNLDEDTPDNTPVLPISNTLVHYSEFLRSRYGAGGDDEPAEIRDETCYRLLSVDSTFGLIGGLRFNFGMSSYFQFLNNTDVCALELARAAVGVGPEEVLAFLPRRGDLKDAFRLKRRSAVAGLNCLLILKNFRSDFDEPPRTVFVLHDRRSGVGHEAWGTRHVVPAGTFQPMRMGSASPADFSLPRSIFREFFEELFDYRDLAVQTTDGSDPLSRIKGMEVLTDPKLTELHLLGLGLDPLTTKPEILFLMVTDWQQLTGLDPLTGRKRLEPRWGPEGKPSFVELSRKALADPAGRDDTLPAGQACLRLAVQHLPRILGYANVP